MSSLAKFEEQDVLIQFDDDAFDEAEDAAYEEDFEDKVHEAQEKLLQLRQEQEQIERQKLELEELYRKKEEFVQGRGNLTDKLTRYVSSLEREAIESQKRADQFLETKEVFEKQLAVVQALRPELWSRKELRSELSRALGTLEDTENCILKNGHILDSLKNAPRLVGNAGSGFGRESFGYWFKSGLAFTLPLLLLGATALIVFLTLRQPRV